MHALDTFALDPVIIQKLCHCFVKLIGGTETAMRSVWNCKHSLRWQGSVVESGCVIEVDSGVLLSMHYQKRWMRFAENRDVIHHYGFWKGKIRIVTQPEQSIADGDHQ